LKSLRGGLKVGDHPKRAPPRTRDARLVLDPKAYHQETTNAAFQNRQLGLKRENLDIPKKLSISNTAPWEKGRVYRLSFDNERNWSIFTPIKRSPLQIRSGAKFRREKDLYLLVLVRLHPSASLRKKKSGSEEDITQEA